MLVFVFHLVALCFSKRCDTHVHGNVWIHKGSSDDEFDSYEGCKKGCFNNKTFTEDGAIKCEKCSIITDENLCVDNEATCQWTKKGKCKSMSCPKMAKTLNTGYIGKSRMYKECVNGTIKEQHFNKIYIDDYLANFGKIPPPNATLNPRNYDGKCDDHQSVADFKCNVIPSIEKQRCERAAGDNDTFQKCLLDQQTLMTNLNYDEYVRQNYYTTTQAWCQHDQEVKLKKCNTAYENSLEDCAYDYGFYKKDITHINTIAARQSCHRVYGCMYSKANQRCSVWAVWAFVVVLVLMIIIVGGGLVALFLIFGKDKLSRP